MEFNRGATWLTISALCALLISSLLYFCTSTRRRRSCRLPPGPLPWPVVGNLPELAGGLPHVRLARLAEKHGPLMCLHLGPTPTVVASSADVAREFLLTHDKAFASRPHSQFVEIVHCGQANAFLLAPYGSHWRHVRKVATLQLFSARRIRERQHLRREELALLVHSLAAAGESAASVDLTRVLSSMMEDLICRTVLGRPMSDVAVGGGGPSLTDLLRRASTVFLVAGLGEVVPWLGFLDRGIKRTMDQLKVDLHALWGSLIAERQKLHQLNGLQGRENRPQDVLDELLLSDPYFSRPDIKETYLLDLIAAGLDTSSMTLDWTMAELFNNPSVLKKLQVEVDTVVGRERMVEESDMPNLPYVTATLKEALRLHPPATLLIPHMAEQACQVMGYSLPAGTRLMVNAWAIGRDPATWEDPEKFWPERFLTQGSDQDRSQQFSWIPFGSGRRSCPGAPLAMSILELTVANLVHCFDWQLPQGQSHVDMSEKMVALVSRQQPLVATPIIRISLTQPK